MLIRLPKSGRALGVPGSSGVGRNGRTDLSRRKTPCLASVAAMPRDLPELRASHEDRDRVVDTLRTAGGDGRLTVEELDARVERALSARTQGELAALVADLSAASAKKDVLVVEQTGGKWTRAGRWTGPNRMEVRTKLCRVTFGFTAAV